MADTDWAETLDGDAILELLVGDPQTFTDAYWNRRPHHHHTGDEGRFRTVLDARAMDEMMAERHLREPYIRIAKDGRPLAAARYMRKHVVQKTPVGGVLDVDKAAAEFNAGATVLLDSVDHHYAPLEVLCRKLGQRLNAHAEAVAFATPASVQGLSVHYDDTEVFVMQISGTKRWTVYDQVRPLVGYGRAVNPATLGAPVLEVELWPGDCLYIPWGAPHFAVSGDEVSCHVSVQLRPQTWGRLLEELIEDTIPNDRHERVVPGLLPDEEAIASDAAVRLRNAVRVLQDADLNAFVQRQVQKPKGPKNSARGGFLRQAALRTALDLDHAVVRNDSMPITVAESGNSVHVKAGGQTVQYPAQARQIIEAASGGASVRLADLDCGLDDHALLKVVGHLSEIGVLLIAAPQAAPDGPPREAAS